MSLIDIQPKAFISIHAAREGGDAQAELTGCSCPISIHAAREGGDETGGGFVAIELLFQSTPPVKAATLPIIEVVSGNTDFNPRRP